MSALLRKFLSPLCRLLQIEFSSPPDDSGQPSPRPMPIPSVCYEIQEESSVRNPFARRAAARKVREEAAEIAFLRPHPEQLNNGEEAAYRGPDNHLNYIANFTKGLPHDELGEVDAKAYRFLLKAIASGNPEDFEKVPLGTPGPGGRKLTNPQAGLAFDLEGPDAHAVTMRPAPRIDQAENSAEMGELYWMALLRDVNFIDFDSNADVLDAANSLTRDFTDFRGPKENGKVTLKTLFRGFTPGDLMGPYVSQFLLKDIPYGTLNISQQQKTAVAARDYMTEYQPWLDVQRGVDTSGQDQFDGTRRYMRNMRDLATYVHFDALYEAYLNACLILLGIHAPFDPGNPYTDSITQAGFGTFGGPHILSLVTEVATRALKAVWHQKWFVHRRLRPETFGGRIHNHLTHQANYPIDAEILNSSVVDRIFSQYGTYLLPMAFPEGSPTHPAYGAGHATVAGACVTVLKAWFDESYVLPEPVIPNADGTALTSYTGPDHDKLTVGGELNKVAANIAIGRNMAGVHWRTDYTESVKLGEAIAIGILQEQKATYNEASSLHLTKFDGTMITI